MRSRGFNYHRLIAFIAILALTVIHSLGMARAKTNPPPQRTAVPNINADGEIRVFDGFVDDWLKLHQQQIVLSKKSSITNSEFTAFRSSSEGLKNRCSEFQTSLRNLVRKLKEADRWNGLDEEVLALPGNARFKTSLRDLGGPKRILEAASSDFCSQAQSEITEPVDRLRPKLSAQVQDLFFNQTAQRSEFRFVRASYQPPTPVFKYAFRCTGSVIRILARQAAGKELGEKLEKNWECFCLEECGTSSPT